MLTLEYLLNIVKKANDKGIRQKLIQEKVLAQAQLDRLVLKFDVVALDLTKVLYPSESFANYDPKLIVRVPNSHYPRVAVCKEVAELLKRRLREIEEQKKLIEQLGDLEL